MLQRTNVSDSPAGRATTKGQSSSTPADMVAKSSSHPNEVDRSTSALNRRILPHGVDGRSAPAKRLLGLIRDLSERVDDPADPVTRARLVAAATLVMAQESLAHGLAAGKAISPDDVVRVTNATERALARLS